MNKEEATKFLVLVKVAYPSSYKNIDDITAEATVNMWHQTFADVPYAIMEMALDHYRRVSEFEPTVASIYKELKSLYYVALEDVMLSDNETKIKAAKYVMEQTSRFSENIDSCYKIDYSAFSGLIENKNNLLLEGGQTDGS